METEGIRRALNFLKGNVSISEIVADASRSIMALLSEFFFLSLSHELSYILFTCAEKDFPDYYHSLDVWHKSKN